MPRRREVPKREILPDPKFGNIELAKFMNVIMQGGKKAVAERIVYGALDFIEKKNPGKDPLEAFTIAEKFSGQAMKYTYVDENRIGDHICYYSDLTKMRAHYPGWDITVSLEETIGQIVEAWKKRG